MKTIRTPRTIVGALTTAASLSACATAPAPDYQSPVTYKPEQRPYTNPQPVYHAQPYAPPVYLPAPSDRQQFPFPMPVMVGDRTGFILPSPGPITIIDMD